MEINFKGKRALVTGAGKGVGRATAKALVQCGAEVIALTRTQADLDTLVKEAPSIKPLCTDLENIEEAVKAIEEQGDIHLLVNNAAFLDMASFMNIKPENCDKTMNINVKAPLFVAQAVARKMIAGGYGGSIVNVSSVGSKKVIKDIAVYCCSKAALDMLTKVMALELGPHKIRVNSVNPCSVNNTEMATTFCKLNEEAFKEMLDDIPLRRIVELDDLTNAIVFLLSDKAAMVNGANLMVDGGTTVS